MQKIILYYKFVPIKDPEAIRLWQKTLCEKLNLRGRIIIAQHGINGTLGGDIKDLKAYVKETKLFQPFKAMAFKWSQGNRESFPKLSVKVRDEIVTFGALDELQVNQQGIVGGGKRLTPKALHALIEKQRDNVIFFDGRNAYEAAVGQFKNAIVTKAQTTKDFVKEIERPQYEEHKNRPVVTYCTGGVRCEVLSLLMKNRGWQDVYQLDGGIVKYGEKYGDDGLWQGSLYVFDGRMAVKFSDKAKDIGHCIYCKSKTSNYENCANKACNRLILICQNCQQETYCQNCLPVKQTSRY